MEFADTTVLNATAPRIIIRSLLHLKQNKAAATVEHISGANGSDRMEKSTTPRRDEIVGGKSKITIVQQSYSKFPRVKNR